MSQAQIFPDDQADPVESKPNAQNEIIEIKLKDRIRDGGGKNFYLKVKAKAQTEFIISYLKTNQLNYMNIIPNAINAGFVRNGSPNLYNIEISKEAFTIKILQKTCGLIMCLTPWDQFPELGSCVWYSDQDFLVVEPNS